MPASRIGERPVRRTRWKLGEMGPAGVIRDLRIKLIIPGAHGLPELPELMMYYLNLVSLARVQRIE